MNSKLPSAQDNVHFMGCSVTINRWNWESKCVDVWEKRWRKREGEREEGEEGEGEGEEREEIEGEEERMRKRQVVESLRKRN